MSVQRGMVLEHFTAEGTCFTGLVNFPFMLEQKEAGTKPTGKCVVRLLNGRDLMVSYFSGHWVQQYLSPCAFST